jgi:signal transduction histidine kinase
LVSEQRRFVAQILEAAGHLTILVDDLLDFARMEAGSVRLDAQVADVRAIMADVAASLELTAINCGVSLALELDEALPEALVDPPRLRQVALNLAANALKFTPRGGQVTIRTWLADDWVRVEVRDTGIGIPEDALPHLFKKFFRVEGGLTASTKGTGLGLAIAKQLVEAMDGAIGVESTFGEGSTFWFRVPTA